MSLFAIIPKPVRAGIAIAAALAVAGFYLHHRAAIYRDGYEDAVQQVEHELDLQEAANREAMRLVEKRYLASIDAITLERDRLNDQLETLDQEAAADPGALQCGIGALSVQRLNAIR